MLCLVCLEKMARPEQQVQGWVREYINLNIEDVDEQPFLHHMIAWARPSQMSTEELLILQNLLQQGTDQNLQRRSMSLSPKKYAC